MFPQTRALIEKGPASVSEAGPVWFVAGLLDEARVVEIVGLRNLLDDADLEQQGSRFLGEGLPLAGEELLVGGLVLPAQIFGRVAKLLAALLHVGAHHLVGLGLILGDGVH